MRTRSGIFLLVISSTLVLWSACPAIAAKQSQDSRPASQPTREAQRSQKAEQPSQVDIVVRRIPGWVRSALIALAAIALMLTGLSLYETQRRRKAEHDALVDPLTGVANRLAFEQRLAQEWDRSQRYGRPLGLLLIDIDDFKLVNDLDGHAAGDELLKRVAERLTSRLRETDMVARFGGDEFAVICPETPGPNLSKLARNLERQVAELPGSPIGLSIGAAEYERDDGRPLNMIERADASMYERKRLRTGRGRFRSRSKSAGRVRAG